MELATIGLIAALIIVIAYNTFKILKEYERGVVFFLGRFQKVKGPGLIILIPGLQKMVKVDLRVIVLDVPTQDVISRDNVSVRVNAVIYFRIVDPEKADADFAVLAPPDTEAPELNIGHAIVSRAVMASVARSRPHGDWTRRELRGLAEPVEVGQTVEVGNTGVAAVEIS